MVKDLAALVCCLVTCLSVWAQEPTPQKRSTQYVGLQINNLVRQILNFSNANTSIGNPFLITFSSNSNTTGSGMNAGFGYTFNEFNDGDVFNKRTTTINELAFRVGYEKKKNLTPKWIARYGLDALIERSNNTTENSGGGQPSTFKIETISKSNAFGIGPRLTLNYELTERILIGTEANYYFKSGKNEDVVKNTFQSTEFDPITGVPRQVTMTDKTEISEKTKNFQLNLPAVIFLIVKF